jgi:hypothetical protein
MTWEDVSYNFSGKVLNSIEEVKLNDKVIGVMIDFKDGSSLDLATSMNNTLRVSDYVLIPKPENK